MSSYVIRTFALQWEEEDFSHFDFLHDLQELPRPRFCFPFYDDFQTTEVVSQRVSQNINAKRSSSTPRPQIRS